MPDLPTFTGLTNAQAKTLLDAWEPYDGATQQETVRSFKEWLRVTITTEAKRRVAAKVRASHQAAVESAIAPIDDALPGAVNAPAPPVGA